MKKYSLMLALASLMLGSSSLYAAEALNPTAVFSSSELSASNSFTGISGATGLTITMVLNAEELEAIAKVGVSATTQPQIFSITRTSGGLATIGFGVHNTSAEGLVSTCGWYGNWGTTATTQAIANGTNQAGTQSAGETMNTALSSLNWDSLAGLALTYTYSDDSANNLYMSALYKDGSYIEATGVNTAGKYSNRTWGTLGLATDYVSSVSIYSGEATQAQAQALNHSPLSPSVPEPAPATLSLLALAGLAARLLRH